MIDNKVLARLAKIEARCEAATEGPWLYAYSLEDYESGAGVVAFGRGGVCEIPQATQMRAKAENEANGSFIAHSRADVPALLAGWQVMYEALRDVLRTEFWGEQYAEACTRISRAAISEAERLLLMGDKP